MTCAALTLLHCLETSDDVIAMLSTLGGYNRPLVGLMNKTLPGRAPKMEAKR